MHLTVRMAWHDNNWNGKVCCNPEGNTYCTGAHSLLSGRIEKKKDTDFEQQDGIREAYVAENFAPASVPPCYWSINAFGDRSFPVEHQHAFKSFEEFIPDVVKPYSVFTWPFKLSFVHNEANKKIHGRYWPDLDQRIDRYINKFEPGESIIFFYANYDNPVSADDMKYLLLGCSVVKEKPVPQHFDFTIGKLFDLRKSKSKLERNGEEFIWNTDISMQNFPTMNWMLQFTHDPETAILLPYREYIQYVDKFPDQEQLLLDMRVVIEEESLISGFKYVSMDIDDDKCLYLLYKIRRSILKMKEHNRQVIQSDFQEQEERIRMLIEKAWHKRGVYPGLQKVLHYWIEDRQKARELAGIVAGLTDSKNDLLHFFERIRKEDIPEGLDAWEDELLDLAEDKIFKKWYAALAKLSLFVLTQEQVGKIIENKELLKQVEKNPYILYEQYEAGYDDLDKEDMQDEPIDLFKVDMAMIPDKKFVKRHRKLQNLSEDSPQRLRSVIIHYLKFIGLSGHCYDSAQAVLDNLYEHPLIYKNEIRLDNEAILNVDSEYRDHFLEYLYVRDTSESAFFYLREVKQSEEFIQSLIELLIARPIHRMPDWDLDAHISQSLEQLSKIIQAPEEKQLFEQERRQLYTNIFEKSFYLLTGKPGAGKTYEISKMIEHLHNMREDVLILAPTGKAALRLSENIRKFTNLDKTAQTIDGFLFSKGFGWLYEDWGAALSIPEEEKLSIENLVIDESSMLDLNKLTLLLSVLKTNDSYPCRIILVGDENQLPPIGYGKPFHDIIQYIQSRDELASQFYIHLVSNCRQENDPQILKLAEAFTDKTRCYEEAFNIIDSGEGAKSKGLHVYQWKDAEQLLSKMDEALQGVFEAEGLTADDCGYNLNELFGLYDKGYVKNKQGEFPDKLRLENFQILTPYRTGFYGTLGINRYFQEAYRDEPEFNGDDYYFRHADKVIRLSNWYWGRGENRRLTLSNGSIGVVNIGSGYRKYFFKDNRKPFWSVDDEENFDLAYAITVHKSQGSDFRNVFLVIPQKEALLCRELLYTALTRSQYRLFIFIQESDHNLLMKAKNKSHLIHRNSSIFKVPLDKKEMYVPEIGVSVGSKVEYIIYKALQKSGLEFKYEAPMQLEQVSYKIRPDFTIYLRDGRTVYWEHLGMLDTGKYYRDWQDRRKDYQSHGLESMLVTTDDLEGITHERVERVIEDIKTMDLSDTTASRFSLHHYPLK